MPTYSRGMILLALLLLNHLTYIQGIKASQEAKSHKQRSRHTRSMSAMQISEAQLLTPEHAQLDDPEDIKGLCSTLFDPLLSGATRDSRRMRTAKSGNPLITAVHQSGVFDMELLYCICPNAVHRDEQLIQSGLFPSSYKQIETAFTFSVLDDFLTDNLECKTTAQQYYSKLQSITNRMFPGSVPV